MRFGRDLWSSDDLLRLKAVVAQSVFGEQIERWAGREGL
jgi:hypothetical protein